MPCLRTESAGMPSPDEPIRRSPVAVKVECALNLTGIVERTSPAGGSLNPSRLVMSPTVRRAPYERYILTIASPISFFNHHIQTESTMSNFAESGDHATIVGLLSEVTPAVEGIVAVVRAGKSTAELKNATDAAHAALDVVDGACISWLQEIDSLMDARGRVHNHHLDHLENSHNEHQRAVDHLHDSLQVHLEATKAFKIAHLQGSDDAGLGNVQLTPHRSRVENAHDQVGDGHQALVEFVQHLENHTDGHAEDYETSNLVHLLEEVVEEAVIAVQNLLTEDGTLTALKEKLEEVQKALVSEGAFKTGFEEVPDDSMFSLETALVDIRRAA
ncbi:hypothetical protein BKA62DRAFT_108953 [Auriculariales sp. MPI-PUGE-AT-0066]|nr:hypothetical protein BKA62DRAFT_108953 [Auriculariales sp. MPI-PUGE-AT-0066]